MQEFIRIPSDESDMAGPYNADYIPYFWGVMHALDKPSVEMVVMMKAAQIGWTLLETAWIAKIICTAPSRILGLFPKEDKARDFMEEKFEKLVSASPEVAKKVDVSGSRRSGNRATKKNFVGGFLKVVGSNSVSNVKSTPAPIVIVEEPDDTNASVGDQGDAIRLARERLKRFRNKKLIIGGTPSVDGVSEVQHYTNLSSQRVLPIVCHECDQSHVLDWENVTWIEHEKGDVHPIFGRHAPESARYMCPHCACIWDDWQRQRNIYDTCKAAVDSGDEFAGWVATVETDGVSEGFKDLSELYVCLPGTSLADVVRDFLEAEHEAELGDEAARIVFRNSKLAKVYQFTGKDSLDSESLAANADDYNELVCPSGGLVVTAGVDIQHDRIAIIIRAFGRNEESWLMYWGEIAGNPVDKNDPIWQDVGRLLFNGFHHDLFGKIYLQALSIDSSDGGTSDAVYYWVRRWEKAYRNVTVMAIKGDSNDYGKKEIFRRPSAVSKPGHVDPKRKRKADKHEIAVFMVGTHKAKDVILKRLSGTSARMHSYKTARADYWEQVTAEVKAPSKKIRGSLTWQLKAGRRNEALDCEVYALHASRAIRVDRFTAAKWDSIENSLSQIDLLSPVSEQTVEQVIEKKSTVNTVINKQKSGFSLADLGRRAGRK